jgi:hypothetical protein
MFLIYIHKQISAFCFRWAFSMHVTGCWLVQYGGPHTPPPSSGKLISNSYYWFFGIPLHIFFWKNNYFSIVKLIYSIACSIKCSSSLFANTGVRLLVVLATISWFNTCEGLTQWLSLSTIKKLVVQNCVQYCKTQQHKKVNEYNGNWKGSFCGQSLPPHCFLPRIASTKNGETMLHPF